MHYCYTATIILQVTRRKIEKETGGTTFACTVRLLASKAKPGVFIPSVVKCVSNDARSIRLDGDLVKFFGDSSFIRNTEISFPESLIVDGAVDLDAADPLTISISRGSGIISSPFTGTYKVLVVRVTDGVNAPTNTVAELGTKTFDDDVNLVSNLAVFFSEGGTAGIQFRWDKLYFLRIGVCIRVVHTIYNSNCTLFLTMSSLLKHSGITEKTVPRLFW